MEKLEISPTLGIRKARDFERLPSFRQHIKLTPELVRGAIVIEPYRSPELVHCGLTCNQGHNKGYIIRLSDGTHTNVGHRCGVNHFHASDFLRQVRDVHRREATNSYKERINDLIDSIPLLMTRYHSLWTRSKRLQTARKNFKKLYPNEIQQDLRNRAQRHQFDVSITRKLSATEQFAFTEKNNDDHSAKGKAQSQYTDEIVGTLFGLSVFIIDPIACLGLGKEIIDKVEQSDENLSDRQIKDFSQYRATIEEKFNDAEKVIMDADHFFNERNFSLLPVLSNQKYTAVIERIDWDFETSSGKLLSVGQFKRLKQKQMRA